jgi:hypothetical protein
VVIAPTAACASVARRHVTSVLEAAARPELVDTVRLAVTELATNAALHARTDVTVTVRFLADERLRLEVGDGSTVLPQEHADRPTSTVGRGLHLLDSLGRWGVEPVVKGGRTVGKVVWFSPAEAGDSGGPPPPDPVPTRDDVRAVLGRYASDRVLPATTGATGGPVGGAPLVAVRLLNFPLRLFADAREHHDELMREFALLSLQRASPTPSVAGLPPRLVELIDLLGRRYGAAGERRHPARDAALARGDLAADLTHHVSPGAAGELSRVAALLEEAELYCRQGFLLTMPGTPRQQRFVRWFTSEFVRQSQGLPPIPWDGPYLPVGP